MNDFLSTNCKVSEAVWLSIDLLMQVHNIQVSIMYDTKKALNSHLKTKMIILIKIVVDWLIIAALKKQHI